MAKLALLLCLVAGCGKSERPAPVVVEDARGAHDAMVIVDAPPPPFAIETTAEVTTIRPHGAKCPSIEWRKATDVRAAVRVHRCRDRSFADQIPELRDMASQLRAIDPSAFEEIRLFGSVDFYSWPELGRRYIAYAKDHPYTGKQTIHDYVIEAGANPQMWPEYAAIFQRRPRLVSVEKCTAGRASRKDEIGAFLRAEGVKGNAEIVLGCSMGFLELLR